jgi:hypothetical protein
MWPPPTGWRFDFDTKYVITTAIAVAALITSVTAIYFSVHQVDDVRVVIAEQFPPIVIQDQMLSVRDQGQSFMFLNVGNRSAAIMSIALHIGRKNNRNLSACYQADHSEHFWVTYQITPFVLKPGDIVTATGHPETDESTGKVRVNFFGLRRDFVGQTTTIDMVVCYRFHWISGDDIYNGIEVPISEMELALRGGAWQFTSGDGLIDILKPYSIVGKSLF